MTTRACPGATSLCATASEASSGQHPIASRREHEVVFDFPKFAGKAELPGPFRFVHTFQVGDQALLNPEHRVRPDVRVVRVEDMCDERLMAIRLQNEMQMLRAIVETSKLTELLSHRPIVRIR